MKKITTNCSINSIKGDKDNKDMGDDENNNDVIVETEIII